MNLWLVWKSLGRHKALVAVGALTGLLLGFLTLYSVGFKADAPVPKDKIKIVSRDLSTYSKTTAVLVDAEGYGLLRTDLPIAQNAKAAPAFAFLATSSDVTSRVEAKLGSLKDKVQVEAEPVRDSPVVEIVVQGRDESLVQSAAIGYAQALSDYVRDYQDSHGVKPEVRIVLRPLGSSGPPEKIQSRAVEIAAIMFLAPLLAVIVMALMWDNLRGSWAAAAAEDRSAQLTPTSAAKGSAPSTAVTGPGSGGPQPSTGMAPSVRAADAVSSDTAAGGQGNL